jgi:putative ABC transport system permease protein
MVTLPVGSRREQGGRCHTRDVSAQPWSSQLWSGPTWTLAAALAALLTLTVGVGRWAGLRQERSVLTAAARAVVQLALVGAVIGLIFRTPGLAPVYLALVWTAASRTSAGRLGGGRTAFGVAAVAIGSGTLLSGLIVFGCGALPWATRTSVPFLVQLMGGSMTATTLAGQRLIDDVTAGWNEVEGWLALGATPQQAVAEPARRSAARALVPALDQTRNVGLVVLPGAYVGLLLGGSSPLEAGRVQLLVLIGLLAAETVAAVAITRLLAPRLGSLHPG